MKKIYSLLMILLTAFAVMSCDKEDNNVSKPGANNGKRLLKTVYYDGNDIEVGVEEWTYSNNFSCMTAHKDGVPVRKMELRESGNEKSELVLTWSDGSWNLLSERIFKMDSQGRTLSIESKMGYPINQTGSSLYTYSGDSTIIVSSRNGQVDSKNVTVKKGSTTETILYSYLGNSQWKELEYRKTVWTFVDGDDGKPLSWASYAKDGNMISRNDYEWNGQNYKMYLTFDGAKRLHDEYMVDGNTTTQIVYSTYTDEEMPIEKIVTKEMGNTTEKYTYGYTDGDWVLHQKKVDYYEDTSK